MTLRKLTPRHHRRRLPDGTIVHDYEIVDAHGNELGGGASHPSKAAANKAAAAKIETIRERDRKQRETE